MWAFPFILLLLILDQSTKWFFNSEFALGESHAVIPNVFHLTLVHNTGVAFGMLQGLGQVILILVAISIIIVGVLLTRVKSRYEKIALGLVLAGAVGNLIDRLSLGYVIDFLDFRVWPVFNVADICVSAGVGLIILQIIRGKRESDSV